MDHYCLIYSSCPDEETAGQMAAALLDRRLAACVSVLPGITSFYEWDGQRETSGEVLLMIKTTAARYADVESLLCELHPYELPEVVAVSIERGLPDYLSWVSRMTQAD